MAGTTGFGALKRSRPTKETALPDAGVEEIASRADDDKIDEKVKRVKKTEKPLKDLLVKISLEHHRKLGLIAAELSEKSFSKVSQRGIASRSLERAIDDLCKEHGIK